jgi:hypothetical protein
MNKSKDDFEEEIFGLLRKEPIAIQRKILNILAESMRELLDTGTVDEDKYKLRVKAVRAAAVPSG